MITTKGSPLPRAHEEALQMLALHWAWPRVPRAVPTSASSSCSILGAGEARWNSNAEISSP